MQPEVIRDKIDLGTNPGAHGRRIALAQWLATQPVGQRTVDVARRSGLYAAAQSVTPVAKDLAMLYRRGLLLRSGRRAFVWSVDPRQLNTVQSLEDLWFGLPPRFWAMVEVGPSPTCRPDLGPCWLWTGNGERYGGFVVGQGRTHRAHVVCYEAMIGVVPEGLQLDHLCRVTRCVRPGHLEPVTGRENVLRGTGFAAVNAAKTHCVHGHEFTPANTAWSTRASGYKRRTCRTCNRLKAEAYRRRKAAQKT
jgi:hypothetical protein